MSGKFPKRVFIALNPPSELKEELADFKEKWPSLPCRWVRPENLHITLAFLGNTGKKELERVEDMVQKLSQNHDPFPVILKKICYGPPKRTPPSLVWVEGEPGEEILRLKKEMDGLLSEKTSYTPPNRRYIPHITLGRIKKFEWRRFNPQDRPRVNQKIDLEFEASSVEVMESRLKRSGPEYKILGGFEL